MRVSSTFSRGIFCADARGRIGNASCRQEVEKLLSLRSDGSFALDLKYFRHHKEDIAYARHGGEQKRALPVTI